MPIGGLTDPPFPQRPFIFTCTNNLPLFEFRIPNLQTLLILIIPPHPNPYRSLPRAPFYLMPNHDSRSTQNLPGRNAHHLQSLPSNLGRAWPQRRYNRSGLIFVPWPVGHGPLLFRRVVHPPRPLRTVAERNPANPLRLSIRAGPA